MTTFSATKLLFAASLMMALALPPAIAEVEEQTLAFPSVLQSIHQWIGEGGDTPVGR
ncbi:MAG: hypothetical protein ACREM3_01375 [Candidatus Rokuibacteriota bacterium]